MQWINTEVALPKITDDKPFVKVKVKTEHNGTGVATFGYSGYMGESMRGSFWSPIREFKGEVHSKNEITHWMYISEYEKIDICPNCGCGNPKKTYDGYWCKMCKTEI